MCERIADSWDGAAVLDAIVKLFTETERVGIRRFEEHGASELVARLTPSVRHLLDRACEILGAMLSHFESEDDDLDAALGRAEGNPELEIVPLRTSTRSPGAVIGDLAFMAVAELRQHHNRLLGHRATQDAQEIISDCGCALRAIKKSLYALEPLLCAVEQRPRRLPPRLGTSLQVRRQYHKLWSFAAATGHVDPSTARAALRGAGTRIAMLTGAEVYNQLREDDRFRIRELQARILEWLRDGDDEVIATRLWQDFALFVEMLRQVNLREELIEHDREVLREAVAALTARGEVAVPEVCQMLAMVIGLDDALDALVSRAPRASVLLRELARVRAHLQDPQQDDKPSTTVAL